MPITAYIYTELRAPIGDVRDALRCPSLWAALPSGGKQLGEFWHWGDELYHIALHEEGDEWLWTATPATGIGPQLSIIITLSDAVVVTHANISVTLKMGGLPWQRAARRRRLERLTRDCVTVLSAHLKERGAQSLIHNDGYADEPLAQQLRPRYPNTVAAFETMGALDHLERVWQLEQGWSRITNGEYDHSYYSQNQSQTQNSKPDYDLIYAGGSLGLLHAALMARRYGWRVLVFDRGEVGCAHREWNISRKELAALVELGLASWDELAPIVMTEYRTGLVRFYDSPENGAASCDLWLPGVLDVALDAGALLRLARRKFEEAGGIILDRRSLKHVAVQHNQSAPFSVQVELENLVTGEVEHHIARLLLDGMGSTSPLALLRHAGHPFAGVCPTVGTVAAGFAQDGGPRSHDPTLGDILVTIDDSQRGQQLMWEGFPGRNDELTVYLFYYDTVESSRQSAVGSQQQVELHPSFVLRHPCKYHSLLALFEEYFALLPTYKRPGPEIRHLKPVYGYIPARHSLRAQEAPLLRGVLPVGDSAAQQSPLTFCGFGSHVRNLGRTTSLLDYALQHDLTEPEHVRHISAFQINVSLNWVFSRFMHPWGRPNDVNQLQNIFLRVLNDLGLDLATRFFQDRMHWSDYHKMILGMFARHRPIVGIAWRVLGPAGVRQWIADYLRFSAQTVYAACGRALGARGEWLLTNLCDRIAPSLALEVRARYAEWRAMGWDEG